MHLHVQINCILKENVLYHNVYCTMYLQTMNVTNKKKTLFEKYILQNIDFLLYIYINFKLMFFYVIFSGGPLSALTCCVNARLLSAIKKISPLIYSQSWVGSWVYTTQAMMTFTLIF